MIHHKNPKWTYPSNQSRQQLPLIQWFALAQLPGVSFLLGSKQKRGDKARIGGKGALLGSGVCDLVDFGWFRLITLYLFNQFYPEEGEVAVRITTTPMEKGHVLRLLKIPKWASRHSPSLTNKCFWVLAMRIPLGWTVPELCVTLRGWRNAHHTSPTWLLRGRFQMSSLQDPLRDRSN